MAYVYDGFLNPEICNQFRKAVNESPTIPYEKGFAGLYNLSCAVMDRLDSAVKYLNNHWDYPQTEEDFLCFIMFACILNDGVNSIYEKTIGIIPKCNNEKKYFSKFCMGAPTYLPEEDCPTDEEFFEYFRALSFAHPYQTNRNKTFKKLFGTQVSPWVVVNAHTVIPYDFPEPIGIRSYSSLEKDDSDIQDIMISFSTLKDFIVEKYSALNDVTLWIKDKAESTYESWKKVKINRNQSNVEVLQDACRIMDDRHENIYDIETMINYLETQISDERNIEVVNQYKEYLISLIPDLCDCIDNLDSSGLNEQIRKAMSFNPTGMHKNASYQLEKIFTYLTEKSLKKPRVGSNEEWGIIQAKAFYNDFAKKWVYIDVYSMDYDEIKLLITVSLFMECKEQNRLG